MELYTTRLKRGLPVLMCEGTILSEVKAVNGSDSLVKLCRDDLKLHERAEEYVFAFGLDTKGRIIGAFEISHGTVNSTLLTPREVLIRMLLIGACGFIIVHNHPSQDVTPSKDDYAITERLNMAGATVGIYLLEHLIIGESEYYSMADHNDFDFKNTKRRDDPC